MTAHGNECKCEVCRLQKIAEKVILKYGGNEYVPEKEE